MLAASSRAASLSGALRAPSQRTYHSLTTLPSRKPVIAQGTPGYSAVSGHRVTVFGSTGFLGRYLVSKLGKIGTQVTVPYRDEDMKRHLKLMGDLGQIVPLEWDIRSEQQIAECLRHSDIVYNLVGRDYETKNFSYSAVHADGAARIARIAKECGVERLVHVSHLNASPDSTSAFYRAKFEGEERVKEIFPEATIIRPSIMYGYEDKLLNNMAIWPIYWRLNQSQTQCRPVHVFDVAQALANLMEMSRIERTLNLPGPSTLSYEFLLDLVASVSLRPVSSAPVLPKGLAKWAANLVGKSVWWPTLSPDEVERRFIDDAKTPGDWDVVGVTPSEIENHAITYLRRYRSADNFIRPVTLPPRPTIIEPQL
ncbi:hypothetical protein BD626DRAFT_547726 [Schizophyllum amplum]|uniref:NAD-dependent epimerase/dehydratase domain-containing protein n=1 Tax=Schizophyllum amplum TaxID=97359 RepID=A0A550CGN1_9AGAR|nr:hypothetical protein BD626DRAFT_547726 [Auriculariopsis ampla]